MTCPANHSSLQTTARSSNGKVPVRTPKNTPRIFGAQAIQEARRRVAGDLRRERLDEVASNSRSGGESEALHLHRRKIAEKNEEQQFQDLQDEQIALAEKYYDEQDYLCQLYENSMQIEDVELETESVCSKTTPESLQHYNDMQ